MNILPKKSWHVLSRDNVKKVRKDEADARDKEKEFARRAAIAEQESRIEFMRKRSREDNDHTIDEPTKRRKIDELAATISDRPQHINFFTDLQTGIGLEGAVNKDHEKEKKAEQEKWEKKVGILNYLVDKDSSASDPWYLGKKPETEKSLKKRSIADPLEEMKGHLETKRKVSEAKHSPSLPLTSKSSSTKKPHEQPVHDEEGTKSLKHKKKKKKDKEEKKLLLKKLREDRKRREEGEKIKAEKLLKKHYGLEEEEIMPKSIEEQPGRYNSQYNPHLARKRFK